ncbi:hypothetical protein MD484_g254, partial [Candolleomyces efflorescens]
MEGKKRRPSVEIEEVPDEDAPPVAPLRPPSRKSASSEELSTKKEEKKQRSVEIEEVHDEDAPRASTSRLDPPKLAPTKGKMKRRCSVEMEEVLDEDAPKGSPSPRSGSPKPPSTKGKMKRKQSADGKEIPNEHEPQGSTPLLDLQTSLLNLQTALASVLAQRAAAKGKKKKGSDKIEEGADEDSHKDEVSSLPDLQRIASLLGLPAMDEKGKKKVDGPETDEVVDKDAAEDTSSHPHPGVPPKEHSNNHVEGLDSNCRCGWCPKHSPGKHKMEKMPCGHMKGGRNLIICIDGTANQFGEKNTNVIELYNLILKAMGENQHTWYNSGIGTYARPHWRSMKYWKQVVVHKIDLAIAWNFELTVQAAYRWLADNYQEGDCIFLFGFSRGAFQVRALAGMIEKVGLIHKGNEVQIPFAYELYADPKNDKPKEAATVGSSKGKDVSMAERFKKAFSREWLETDVFYRMADLVKQLWDQKPVLETIEQLVASEKTAPQFLYEHVVETIKTWNPEVPKPAVEDQYLFLRDMVSLFGDATNFKLPKWREFRVLLRGLLTSVSKAHQEVAARFLREYVEDVNCLFELQGHSGTVSSVAISRDGKRIVSGSWDNTIRIWDMEKGEQVGSSLRGHDDWIRSVAISPNGELIVSGSDDKTVRVWDAKTGTQVGESLQGHGSWVSSVAFSHDGKRIVSSSGDGSIQIWEEVEKSRWTQVGDPIRGHDGRAIVTIAISPDDKYIVSGSYDRTIRIWDAKERTQVGELRGHEGWVWSVAISPEGKRIVSASRDNTIRIWDVEKREQVGEPLRGHSGTVYSVAISPDGKYIVSGFLDRTVRIWDLEERKQVGEPLRGHTDWVWSVAILLDGKRIVSGSGDTTVRIWDTEWLFV